MKYLKIRKYSLLGFTSKYLFVFIIIFSLSLSLTIAPHFAMGDTTIVLGDNFNSNGISGVSGSVDVTNQSSIVSTTGANGTRDYMKIQVKVDLHNIVVPGNPALIVGLCFYWSAPTCAAPPNGWDENTITPSTLTTTLTHTNVDAEDYYTDYPNVGDSGNDVLVMIKNAATGTVYYTETMSFHLFQYPNPVKPIITEVSAVVTPSTNATPSYTFRSTKTGLASTTNCPFNSATASTSVIIGLNTRTFATLAPGVHSNCTITVTNGIANASWPLNVTSFTITANSPKAITAFSFASPAVNGTINETAGTIALTVPYGTAKTALTPTIVSNGQSVSPASLVTKDFTNPVTYTVTATDATTKTYTVTVTVAPPPTGSSKSITSFSFANPAATGTINEAAGTISVTVPAGTNVTSLTPTITINGASVSPVSQVAKDFTNPVTYKVTATDSTIKDYVVTVSKSTSTVSTDSNSSSTVSTPSSTLSVGIKNPLGDKFPDIPSFIIAVLQIVLTIGVPIVVLAIIYCGFLFVKALGNPEEISKAKKALIYTIVGAALLLGSFVLANAISKTVDQIKSSS